MSGGRSPKRQRKKEAASARREATRQMMLRQRKRRTYTLVGVTALLLVGGTALALFAFRGGDEADPAASPGAAASPTPAPTPPPIACDGNLPQAAGTEKETYEAAEDQKLVRTQTYIWRLETSCGTIDVELDNARSPKTVNSIVFLTRKGFYDGLTFHRVSKGFVIQGGDPEGTGSGGPGYKVTEAPPDGFSYDRGVVAMAKAQQEAPGTSGSQFFIVSQDSGLPAEYAYVGKVVEGLDVVDRIDALQEEGDAPPPERVFIEKASIIVR